MKFKWLIRFEDLSMEAQMKLWMFLSKKETPVTSGCEFWPPLTWGYNQFGIYWIGEDNWSTHLIYIFELSFFPICKIGRASRLRLDFHVENKWKMGKKTVLSLALWTVKLLSYYNLCDIAEKDFWICGDLPLMGFYQNLIVMSYWKLCYHKGFFKLEIWYLRRKK